MYNSLDMPISQIRQSILGLVSRRGSVSVDAVAHAIGLSKMATRYHLRLLARDGLIVAAPAAHCGGVGRPETLYSLAEEAYDCLPCQYNQLAEHLLGVLVASLGEQPVRTLLRRAGRDQASEAPPLEAGATMDTRITRAVRFLNRRGYACKAVRQAGSIRLVISNCPYRRVAQSHPQICEMDTEMVRTLLDIPARLSDCILSSQGQCQFEIGRN